MRTLASIIAQKNELLAQATEMVTRGLKTQEQKNKYKELLQNADMLSADISAFQTIESGLRNSPTIQEEQSVEVPLTREQRKANLARDYRALFGRKHFEVRDITTATSGDNGASLASQDFDSSFAIATTWHGPIASLAKQKFLTNRGAPTKFVTSDDTASTMTYLSETSNTSGVEADPSVASTVPGTDALVTMVKYSFQEAEDADDFEQFIHDLAFVRAARAIEYSLTLSKDSGTNTQLPNSISGGWLAGLSAGVTQDSGDLAAGPTLAQLNNLAASVDHSYYVNGAFMASPSVFNFLVAQVTTTGAPLYNFDDDGNLLIAGKKLYVNNAMAAYDAASSPIVTFGDYSRSLAYLNGGGLQIRILKERFASTLEGAALIYTRLGSAALLPGAVKALVTAAD